MNRSSRYSSLSSSSSVSSSSSLLSSSSSSSSLPAPPAASTSTPSAPSTASSSPSSSSSGKPQTTAHLPSRRARATPAKSVPLVVPISEATRARIRRKTGKEYLTSADLPASLDLSHCYGLVDVSALG
mmetsp:Transcript_14895/g.44616  ORF Transcript_14895/g.44616 Transcript_14895/m.44616 type:complete len:128 (+) Transcript_14895:62-445(+)